MSVDRYDFIYYDDFGAKIPAFNDKDEDGDYVFYSDYAALEAELEHTYENLNCQDNIIDGLKAERDRYRAALEKIAKGRTDKQPGMSTQSRTLISSELRQIASKAIAGEGKDDYSDITAKDIYDTMPPRQGEG